MKNMEKNCARAPLYTFKDLIPADLTVVGKSEVEELPKA